MRYNRKATRVAQIAWVNFCNKNNHSGIFSLFSIVIDCNAVESPPKLITNVDARVQYNPLSVSDISWHPFVISINPEIIPLKLEGNKSISGESDVMTTKKIAIITPTDIKLIAESRTILDKSKLVFCLSNEIFLK